MVTKCVRAAVVAAFAAVAVAGCSSSAPSQAPPADTSALSSAAAANPNLDPGTSLGNEPAPGFGLRDQFGRAVSLADFRGKAVLLTFADAECTDICPLTTQSMVLARQMLGKAGEDVQLLGVDANPQAHSVPAVMAYSRAHGMVSQWSFLTGSGEQLKAVWADYHVAALVESGEISHTPATFLIDQQGRLKKAYLSQMAYSAIGQSAQVMAQDAAALLPGHPRLLGERSLAEIPGQTPADRVSLPALSGPGGTVTLGPGKPRLVVFFASWVAQLSDLKAEMAALNGYARTAAQRHLPELVAVDVAPTEPSARAARDYLAGAGALDYPVGIDASGRLADGYQVKDQPWLALVDRSGKITWSNVGWLPVSDLLKAVQARS